MVNTIDAIKREAVEVIQVECAHCSYVEELDDMTLGEAAQYLYEQGWREASNDSYQLQGLVCDECMTGGNNDAGALPWVECE